MEPTSIRSGRDAPSSFARAGEHSQAAGGALGSGESGTADAHIVRKGHATGPAGTFTQAIFRHGALGTRSDNLGLTGQDVRCAVGSTTDDSGRLDCRVKTAAFTSRC